MLIIQGGDPFVHPSQSHIFIEEAKKIIPTLPNRNFPYFKKKIFPIIKNLRDQLGKETKPSVFSKHSWKDFRSKPKHSELEILWERVPRKKREKFPSQSPESLYSHEELYIPSKDVTIEEITQSFPSTDISESLSPPYFIEPVLFSPRDLGNEDNKIQNHMEIEYNYSYSKERSNITHYEQSKPRDCELFEKQESDFSLEEIEPLLALFSPKQGCGLFFSALSEKKGWSKDQWFRNVKQEKNLEDNVKVHNVRALTLSSKFFDCSTFLGHAENNHDTFGDQAKIISSFI